MARIPTYKNEIKPSDGQTQFMNVAQVDVGAGQRQLGEIWTNALDQVAVSAAKYQKQEDSRKLIEFESKIVKLNSYLLDNPDYGGAGTLSGDAALKRINGGWDTALQENQPGGSVADTKYAIAAKEFEKDGKADGYEGSFFTYDNSKSMTDNYKGIVEKMKTHYASGMGASGAAAIDEYVNKSTGSFVKNLTSYQTAAYKAKNEAVFTAKMADHIDNGTTLWNDSNALDGVLSNVKTLVTAPVIGIAQQKGVSDKETIDQLVQENQALVVSQAIKQAVATGNTVAAKELLKKYSGNKVLQGETLTTLTSLVDKGNDSTIGINAVDDIINGTRPPGQANPYMEKNSGGNLDLYNIPALRKAVIEKYGKSGDAKTYDAAMKHIDELKQINTDLTLKDEREATRLVNKLISENRSSDITPELLSRLPANYNVSSRISSGASNNETVTAVNAHDDAGGSTVTLTTQAGEPYDQAILGMLATDQGAAFIIETYHGTDENEKALRKVLSAEAYDTVSAAINKKYNEIEKAKLKAQGNYYKDITDIAKNHFNISSQTHITAINNDPTLRSEYDNFLVQFTKQNGRPPNDAQIKKFIAPFLVRAITKKGIMGGEKETKPLMAFGDDQMALEIESAEVSTKSRKSRLILGEILGVQPDIIEKAAAALDNKGSKVTLSNLNNELLTNRSVYGNPVGNTINPLAIMSEDTYKLAQAAGASDKGLSSLATDTGIAQQFFSGNANSPIGIKMTLYLFEQLQASGDLPEITPEVLAALPTNGQAYKTWTQAVKKLIAVPANRQKLVALQANVVANDTLFSNINFEFLKSVRFNQSYQNELQRP